MKKFSVSPCFLGYPTNIYKNGIRDMNGTFNALPLNFGWSEIFEMQYKNEYIRDPFINKNVTASA